MTIRTVASLLLATTIALASQLSTAAPDPIESLVDGDVLYAQRLSVEAEGATAFEWAGSTTVLLQDGTPYTVNLRTLRDPDGGRYAVEGGAYQAAPDAPVVYELTVTRIHPEDLSLDEAVAGYLEAYPDAGEDELAAFRERWETAEIPRPRPRSIDPGVYEFLDDSTDGDR